MRGTVPLLAAALAATAVVLPAVAQEPAEAERPNIVFILMDNLGYGEVGRLRRRHPARRADAAHRRARRRRARGCSTSTSRRSARRAARRS